MEKIKFIVLSIILTLFSFNQALGAISLAFCEKEAVSVFKNQLSDKQKEKLLSRQFHLTLLKIATLQNKEALPTMESYSKQFFNDLSDDEKSSLSQLVKNYKQSAYLKDLETIEETMVKASYWERYERFSNREASAFVLAHKVMAKDSPFDERDVAILWFASLASDLAIDVDGEFSALYNRSNVSSQIIQYTGAMKGKRPLTVNEIKRLVDKNAKDYNLVLDEIKEKLQIHLRAVGCLKGNEFAGTCRYNNDQAHQFFSRWLDGLKDEISLDELSGISFEDDLSLRYRGKAIFKFQGNRDSRVENPKSDQEQEYQIMEWPYLSDSEGMIKTSEILALQEEINDIPDELEKIKTFHRHSDRTRYGVVDKEKGLISVYDNTGRLVESASFESEKDDLLYSGGAGVFQFLKRGKHGELFTQAKRDQKIRPFGVDIHLGLERGDPVYVLPTDKSNTFVAKEGELRFTTKASKKNYQAYNYSPRKVEYREIKIAISDSDLRSLVYQSPPRNGEKYREAHAVYKAKKEKEEFFLREFLDTLESEKENLMKLYNLENDEYNMLVKFSFGVMQPETKMGTHPRYKIKEDFPFLISLVKKLKGNNSPNSRGPSQIKIIPNKIVEKYKIEKGDLQEARPAALATLGFAADLLSDLKRIEKNHPEIDIDNRLDYLYYLFRGKRGEITKATATPDLNRNVRQIKGVSKMITIYQEEKE
ncbi:hypothetical protein HBN50_07280 [Halobacteriovorax sp. GB3]|uniref:hypothetical protein n=1 Tax=Halobacteriovorax sp. GB3 TaxID=2719615 RepID=UPI00235E8EFA|nr:hypothetical protein [Halobacteriovorax sp. GB3]MDD0852891.1 hypothetical protein [Halobacteriovorax sp. GB3]